MGLPRQPPDRPRDGGSRRSSPERVARSGRQAVSRPRRRSDARPGLECADAGDSAGAVLGLDEHPGNRADRRLGGAGRRLSLLVFATPRTGSRARFVSRSRFSRGQHLRHSFLRRIRRDAARKRAVPDARVASRHRDRRARDRPRADHSRRVRGAWQLALQTIR